LIYTEEIKDTREVAFFVKDIVLIQKDLLGAKLDESGEIVSFSVEGVDLERFRSLINEVNEAIQESRYEEARILAEELKIEVDLIRTETLTALVLGKSIKNILKKYWYLVVLIVLTFVATGYFSFKKIKKKLLNKKIQKMKIESGVLLGLMKETQEERFKRNEISALVYNIRIKKYEEKLNKIKEELPVLEKELRGKEIKGKNNEKKQLKVEEKVRPKKIAVPKKLRKPSKFLLFLRKPFDYFSKKKEIRRIKKEAEIRDQIRIMEEKRAEEDMEESENVVNKPKRSLISEKQKNMFDKTLYFLFGPLRRIHLRREAKRRKEEEENRNKIQMMGIL
jgi:hypothetical protein